MHNKRVPVPQVCFNNVYIHVLKPPAIFFAAVAIAVRRRLNVLNLHLTARHGNASIPPVLIDEIQNLFYR